MEHQKNFGQVIDFQKTAFTNIFDAVIELQDQGVKLFNTSLEQNQFISKEQKKIMSDWTEAFKKNRKNLKETVNANFEMLQNLIDDKKPKPTARGKAS
ncbi:MAG: hypothetical protein GY710_08515 [Desulfobacteraceae bacterium]|nr:hypothetical protein [Desulfobacteraceae bacterium]